MSGVSGCSVSARTSGYRAPPSQRDVPEEEQCVVWMAHLGSGVGVRVDGRAERVRTELRTSLYIQSRRKAISLTARPSPTARRQLVASSTLPRSLLPHPRPSCSYRPAPPIPPHRSPFCRSARVTGLGAVRREVRRLGARAQAGEGVEARWLGLREGVRELNARLLCAACGRSARLAAFRVRSAEAGGKARG